VRSRRDLLLGLAAAATTSDAEGVSRLLGFERRLEAAYRGALARDAVDPELGRRLLGHEREHVRGLEQALDDLGRSGPRATAPAPTIGIDFASRRAFAASALQLERETVDAYRDVLTGFRDDHLVQPLGSIMACGAQHEVALRQALGTDLLRNSG
jgi:Ferritin-like domain